MERSKLYTNVLNVISLGGAVIGSAMVASHFTYSKWGYFAYMASSIASVILLRGSNASKAIEWQCWFFILVNAYGAARWFNWISF